MKHKPMTLGETRVIDGESYTCIRFTKAAYDTDKDAEAVRAVDATLRGVEPDVDYLGGNCVMCPEHAPNTTCPAKTRLCGDGAYLYVVRTAAVPLLHLEGVME